MLSNVEYAHVNKVPTELSAEMEAFAMFTIRMPKGGNLFSVKPHDKTSLNAMRKQTEKENEIKRQENLARYIQQGYAFQTESEFQAENNYEGDE